MNTILKLILILLFAFSGATYGARYEDGEGRFYSQSEDRLGFIKKQLLSNAFNDVLTKEMKKLGLDSQLFWRKYEEKFQEYFAPIEENLKEKFGLNDETIEVEEAGKTDNKLKKKRESFERALRIKRLTLRRRFGRLSRLIKSYSIKTMSRSTNMPGERYMRVRASVNQKSLNRTYIKFTADVKNRTFGKLYVSADFSLNDLLWTDMGVLVDNDFTSVVKEHWKKFLEDKLEGRIESVVLVDESIKKDLENRMKLPLEAIKALAPAKVTTGGREVKEEVENNEAVYHEAKNEDPLYNSLWLKVTFKISKVSEEVILGKRRYGIEGKYILITMDNSKLISHGHFNREEKEFDIGNNHALSSSLATSIYRTPIHRFEKFRGVLANTPRNFNVLTLNISGINTVLDLVYLKELLVKRGITRQFRPSIESYQRRDAKMKLEFHGSIDDVYSVLRSLSGQTVGGDLILSIPEERAISNITLLKSKAPLEEEKKLQERKL